jgi:myo-inositol-1(or 4)-monophosphatase
MDLIKLQSQVIRISRDVGAMIKNEQQNFSVDKVQTKGLNDFVSYVDKAAEDKIVTQLAGIFPEAGFIAEENAQLQKKDRYNWVIDPLDGTTNFIHGIPVFSVSIALMEGDEVILGVIYEPNRDECFYASKNNPAFCNNKKIHVSEASALSDSILATGFPYSDFSRLDKYLSLFRQLLYKTHGLRRMGSAAVDLAYVACGRFEGFFEYGLNAWDVAAGTLIVQQAGGRVSDFTCGDDFIFGAGIVASNTRIHDELMHDVKKYFV